MPTLVHKSYNEKDIHILRYSLHPILVGIKNFLFVAVRAIIVKGVYRERGKGGPPLPSNILKDCPPQELCNLEINQLY